MDPDQPAHPRSLIRIHAVRLPLIKEWFDNYFPHASDVCSKLNQSIIMVLCIFL
jgi:hypothetical protein